MGDPVAIYAGSNGRYYTDWQRRRKLATGAWRHHVRDRSADRWLVETADGALLVLERTTVASLPEWAEVRADETAARVVDTRRWHPSRRE